MIPERYTVNPETEGFTFHTKSFDVVGIPNKNYAWCAFTEMERYLLDGGELDRLDDERAVSDNIYSGYMLVEYKSIGERQNDIEGNTGIEYINAFKSKTLENDRQIAQTVGYFDYNGKYYLVSHIVNRKTSEINPEIGVYKGVVINHGAYKSSRIGEDEGVKRQIDKTLLF